MTVATQMKQTIAALQGIEGTIRTYLELSRNPEDKSVWQEQLQRVESVRTLLQQRMVELEGEEPQYKGY